MVTPASTLVKRNFIFQRVPPHARCALVRDALVTPASSLVRANFCFQKAPPSREVCLGARSLQHAGVSLGEEESLMEIKFLFTKADAGVIKGFRTKADLAWGGSHLEKKIPLHQGSPRRDEGISHQGRPRVGGCPF